MMPPRGGKRAPGMGPMMPMQEEQVPEFQPDPDYSKIMQHGPFEAESKGEYAEVNGEPVVNELEYKDSFGNYEEGPMVPEFQSIGPVSPLSDRHDYGSDPIGDMMVVASRAARNYRRIASVLSKLYQIRKSTKGNRRMASDVSNMTKKVAGLFSLIDTVDDLDRPLDEIERAVHSMYGDQSKNSTFYLKRRGKGHLEDKE